MKYYLEKFVIFRPDYIWFWNNNWKKWSSKLDGATVHTGPEAIDLSKKLNGVNLKWCYILTWNDAQIREVMDS